MLYIVYIGETENGITQQLNGHKSDICHEKNKSVAEHFDLSGHSVDHFQVCILKRTNSTKDNDKSKHQFRLNCIKEELNKDSDFLLHYLKKQ